VRVGARIGLGDREGDLRRSPADAPQPSLLLSNGPVSRQDAPHDGRGDHDQQRCAASRGDLLAHPRQRRHPQAAPVVLLGNVDPQISARGQGFPKLARWFASVALALHVLAAEAVADARHGFSQHGLLLRGHKRQGGRGSGGRHGFRCYGIAQAAFETGGGCAPMATAASGGGEMHGDCRPVGRSVHLPTRSRCRQSGSPPDADQPVGLDELQAHRRHRSRSRNCLRTRP
jgi:hypothetical protein